jgi:GDP-mannose 6-dehydrogenase
LAGSNRQYIEEVIPHIGSLLSADLKAVVEGAEMVIIATKIAADELSACLSPGQAVFDLVNLNPAQRPDNVSEYGGICW